MAPEGLPAHLGAGRWGIYARIAGIALLASSAVVGALLFAVRAPGNANDAIHALNAHATPSAAPSETPTVAPIPIPTEPATATATATATPTPTATATATPTATATATPTATATATPTPTATPAATPPLAATDGTISTPPSGAGHRVFVDGHYAGDSPGPIKVRCGQHLVKIGSGGTSRPLDVPCGGDVVVPAR